MKNQRSLRPTVLVASIHLASGLVLGYQHQLVSLGYLPQLRYCSVSLAYFCATLLQSETLCVTIMTNN